MLNEPKKNQIKEMEIELKSYRITRRFMSVDGMKMKILLKLSSVAFEA